MHVPYMPHYAEFLFNLSCFVNGPLLKYRDREKESRNDESRIECRCCSARTPSVALSLNE